MKVLMVIKTTGLDYDDRLRKESLCLHRLGFDVEILVMEYANRAGQRVVYQHLPAVTIRLWSRQWFARSKGLWFKAPEMYVRFLGTILKSKPDVIWCHDFELIGLVPFFILMRKVGFIQRLIWDQHELPSDRFLRTRFITRLLAWLFNGCDVVVSANEQRKNLLQESLNGISKSPFAVLKNYPDRLFANLPRVELPEDVKRWLNGTSFVLAQGGAAPDRHFEELVAAVLGLENLKLIVVGPYQEAQVRRLGDHYGATLSERVLFTGFVPQMEIAPYIDHALASVVLYAMSNENKRLCAPNRLYQAVSRGIPVVVGVNPPMEEFVQRWECGTVLSGSGGDVDDIQSGIKEILIRQEELCRNAELCRSSVTWESQTSNIINIVMP